MSANSRNKSDIEYSVDFEDGLVASNPLNNEEFITNFLTTLKNQRSRFSVYNDGKEEAYRIVTANSASDLKHSPSNVAIFEMWPQNTCVKLKHIDILNCRQGKEEMESKRNSPNSSGVRKNSPKTKTSKVEGGKPRQGAELGERLKGGLRPQREIPAVIRMDECEGSVMSLREIQEMLLKVPNQLDDEARVIKSDLSSAAPKGCKSVGLKGLKSVDLKGLKSVDLNGLKSAGPKSMPENPSVISIPEKSSAMRHLTEESASTASEAGRSTVRTLLTELQKRIDPESSSYQTKSKGIGSPANITPASAILANATPANAIPANITPANVTPANDAVITSLRASPLPRENNLEEDVEIPMKDRLPGFPLPDFGTEVTDSVPESDMLKKSTMDRDGEMLYVMGRGNETSSVMNNGNETPSVMNNGNETSSVMDNETSSAMDNGNEMVYALSSEVTNLINDLACEEELMGNPVETTKKCPVEMTAENKKSGADDIVIHIKLPETNNGFELVWQNKDMMGSGITVLPRCNVERADGTSAVQATVGIPSEMPVKETLPSVAPVKSSPSVTLTKSPPSVTPSANPTKSSSPASPAKSSPSMKLELPQCTGRVKEMISYYENIWKNQSS